MARLYVWMAVWCDLSRRGALNLYYCRASPGVATRHAKCVRYAWRSCDDSPLRFKNRGVPLLTRGATGVELRERRGRYHGILCPAMLP